MHRICQLFDECLSNLWCSGDELKKTVSIVVDVATTLDPDGVDVYFLNRPPMKNVRSSEELHEVFSIPPDGKLTSVTVTWILSQLFYLGPTPIVPVVREILHEKRNIIHERKLLLLIATDGQPTDDLGNPKIEEFRRFLERERRPIEKIPVSIIACTGNSLIKHLIGLKMKSSFCIPTWKMMMGVWHTWTIGMIKYLILTSSMIIKANWNRFE